MALKQNNYTKLRVPVKGSINDEDGKPVKFDFTLLCRRLNQSQIDAARADDEKPISAFVAEVVNGWEGVSDAGDAPLEFNDGNLGIVLDQPGMAQVCAAAYMKEINAVAKV